MKKIIIIFLLLSVYGSCWGGAALVGEECLSSGNDYVFFWDAETTTANKASGTIGSTTNGTVELSTTQAYAGSKSMSTSTGQSYYKFTDSTIFSRTSGTITFYVYGDQTEIGIAYTIYIYGDSNNFYAILASATDTIKFYLKLNGSAKYIVADNGSLNDSAWNKVELIYDGSSGTQTDFTLTVNNGTPLETDLSYVWDTDTTVDYVAIGAYSSTAPIGTLYIDNVEFSE